MSMEPGTKVLLIGVTGGTGRSAVQGLTEGGVPPSSLHALTRTPEGKWGVGLRKLGLNLTQGNLDDEASLKAACQGMDVIYVHATSKDAATADPAEVHRARRLAAAATAAGVQRIIYNGSGGRGASYRISQMDQKHEIEDIYMAAVPRSTTLRASLFMEEFWKSYTRPAILQGKFPFPIPGDRPLKLVAVRDMGLAAAQVLNNPERFEGRGVELAGDQRTPREMCAAYVHAQGGRAVEHQAGAFWQDWLVWLLNRDLYRLIMFFRYEGYSADVSKCREDFEGLLTFDQFLARTHWGDAALTYEGGVQYFDS